MFKVNYIVNFEQEIILINNHLTMVRKPVKKLHLQHVNKIYELFSNANVKVEAKEKILTKLK